MYVLLFMIALMVALTMPIVGGLLLYVWLVTPAAIAYQFCGTLKNMMIASPIIAGSISLFGTWTAFTFNLPIAPLSAVLFALVFLISVIISPKRKITREKYGAVKKD